MPSRDPRLETEVNSQKRKTMATLIMRKQWKYLYAALMLLLLTISTLAGVGPVAAGDRGYGGHGDGYTLPELIPPDDVPGNGQGAFPDNCHGSTGDGYILPELILPPNCADEGMSIPPDMPEPTPTRDYLPDIWARVPDLSLIVADVAEHTGAETAEIEVVRGQSVTWNDRSLGCPMPGMVYTQALVDGYWIVLSYQGQEFDHRVTEQGGFFLCEEPRQPNVGLLDSGAPTDAPK
jgi:hypothetical protein